MYREWTVNGLPFLTVHRPCLFTIPDRFSMFLTVHRSGPFSTVL
jgi:hypothetical protein